MPKRDTVSTTENLIEKRTRLKENMNPALREKLDWILDWQADEHCGSLMSRWKLGEQVADVVKDMQEGQGHTYGQNALGKLEQFMHEDKSILTDARRLYYAYPDKKRVQEICEMTMHDGCTKISYSHVRQLISIKDEQLRQEAMNLTLLNCWTSAQLGQHVQKVNGGKRSNSPNGRAGVPKNAAAVADQQLAFADDFDSRNARVWSNEKCSLSAQVDKIPVTEYTEELAKKLGETAKRMRQLADAAEKKADEAQAAYEKVWKALHAKSEDDIKRAAELTQDHAAELIQDLSDAGNPVVSDADDGDEHLPVSPRATRAVGRRKKVAA